MPDSGALEQKIRPSSRDLLHPLAHRLTYNLPAKHGFNLALSRYRAALGPPSSPSPRDSFRLSPPSLRDREISLHFASLPPSPTIEIIGDKRERRTTQRSSSSSTHSIEILFSAKTDLRTQGRARLLRAPPYWPLLPPSYSSKFAPPIIPTLFSRKGDRCSRISSSSWKFIESPLRDRLGGSNPVQFLSNRITRERLFFRANPARPS